VASDARQPSAAVSLVPEVFHILRTHTLHAMREAKAKNLLITSAMPGEGKSTIAANLAFAVAQTDRRVWLVDCDLRHPMFASLFPEARSGGLPALLTGHAAIGDIVRATRQPHLECVVGGSEARDPSELLDTQLMTQFLHQARESADVVILDCPALLAAVDAEVIALQADAVVIVVQLGKTDRHALARSRQSLERLGVHVIGAVLNETTSVRPATDDGRPTNVFHHLTKALRASSHVHLKA
jgi:capsular exopolysaccharide synthesis family protein